MPVTWTAKCPACAEPIKLDVALQLGETTSNPNGGLSVAVRGSLIASPAIEGHVKVCSATS